MDEFLAALTRLSKEHNIYIFGCQCGASPIGFPREAIELTGKKFEYGDDGGYFLQTDGSFAWHNKKDLVQKDD